MKKLILPFLISLPLLSSCEVGDANYKITDSTGYNYYTDSYTVTSTDCLIFIGKQGFTKGREVSVCSEYSIVDLRRESDEN